MIVLNGRKPLHAWVGRLALVPTLWFSPLSQPAGVAHADTKSRAGSSVPRYNFPPASRGDRFARSGLNFKVGVTGWKRYGRLIKRVSERERIDPYVLGAYVWLESEFDPKQDYTNGPRRALGLGSVQATDFRKYTAEQLMEPQLNLTLTAREFSEKWRPKDMFGTVMDVWYPNWRSRVAKGQKIPVVRSPDVYVQAIANRYYALKEIDRRIVVRK